MRIVKSVQLMQRLSGRLPRPLVLVPTMGALHKGHLALVRKAKRFSGRTGTTAASLFVNPIQFGPAEDFNQYPRTFQSDCELLDDARCDLVFAPHADDMYFSDSSTVVVESDLSGAMCGVSRPGHFTGVCTVVTKLFHIFRPDIAVFGEKDFQQLSILQRMARDLNFPVRIVAHPIVREEDGLALSSRNRYLSEEERRQATVIYSTLLGAEQKVRNGWNSTSRVENWMRFSISKKKLAKVDYVVAVDPVTLQRSDRITPPVLLAAAVFFGKTRLIDNRLIE
ncbi:MAG TPA: pantoate--beta-alanine ligase [Chthoniobacterales bacterium]|nr:pantoate--beta-alanine ligase [Chthoniobacterales bacterium]